MLASWFWVKELVVDPNERHCCLARVLVGIWENICSVVLGSLPRVYQAYQVKFSSLSIKLVFCLKNLISFHSWSKIRWWIKILGHTGSSWCRIQSDWLFLANYYYNMYFHYGTSNRKKKDQFFFCIFRNGISFSKMLSFLNGWSYRDQIGCNWKIFWSSF